MWSLLIYWWVFFTQKELMMDPCGADAALLEKTGSLNRWSNDSRGEKQDNFIMKFTLADFSPEIMPWNVLKMRLKWWHSSQTLFQRTLYECVILSQTITVCYFIKHPDHFFEKKKKKSNQMSCCFLCCWYFKFQKSGSKITTGHV